MKKLLLADVVTHNRHHLMAGFLFASGLAISATALAVPINVDFGSAGHVITSTTFGAASGQSGYWNNITAFSTPSGIVDIGGNATSVAITVTAGTMAGISGLFPLDDANALMEDNFFSSSGASWTISITGLSGTLFGPDRWNDDRPSGGLHSGRPRSGNDLPLRGETVQGHARCGCPVRTPVQHGCRSHESVAPPALPQALDLSRTTSTHHFDTT